jgi:hypothetical protein
MKRAIFISLLLVLAAQGQQQQRIAIIGTEDDGEPPIEFLALSHLTAKLREVASNILPKARYGIMTQQSIVDRLGSQEQAAKICREATCLADLGRKISADYIAQARIGRFSGNLTIKVELYEVGSGNLIAFLTSDSKDVQGLLAILEAKAPDLFKKMPGVSVEPIPLAEFVPAASVAPEPAPYFPPVIEQPPPVADSALQKGAKFGFRFGVNAYDFSFGYEDLNEGVSRDIGFGAGLLLKVQLERALSFNMGLDFYYRELFSREAEKGKETMNEFAISIPIFLQFTFVENGNFHLITGVQLDVPIDTDWKYYYNYFTKHRADVDYGMLLGLTYMANQSLGVDFKCVISTTGLFEDFEYSYVSYEGSNNYKDRSSLRQYGVGLIYFF